MIRLGKLWQGCRECLKKETAGQILADSLLIGRAETSLLWKEVD